MPITQSAKKALRQNVRRRRRNLVKKDAFRDAMKSFKKSPSDAGLTMAFKTLDKAVKTGVIHQNKAARMKSRLSSRLQKKGTASS